MNAKTFVVSMLVGAITALMGYPVYNSEMEAINWTNVLIVGMGVIIGVIVTHEKE